MKKEVNPFLVGFISGVGAFVVFVILAAMASLMFRYLVNPTVEQMRELWFDRLIYQKRLGALALFYGGIAVGGVLRGFPFRLLLAVAMAAIVFQILDVVRILFEWGLVFILTGNDPAEGFGWRMAATLCGALIGWAGLRGLDRLISRAIVETDSEASH